MARETIDIPDTGAYFFAGGDRYHISIDGPRVSIRFVDGRDGASGRVCIHMPAGNVVHIEDVKEPH